MKNKTSDSTETPKQAPKTSTSTAPKQTGADLESRLQKDAMARSRGDAPTANKPNERSPRQENL